MDRKAMNKSIFRNFWEGAFEPSSTISEDQKINISKETIMRDLQAQHIEEGPLQFTAFDELKKHEALRLKAYLPTKKDVWTIGYGHTKTARKGMKITEEQALQLLDKDVEWAEEAVRDLVKVNLNQNQFNALVSFVFNIGATNFRKSTLLRKLNAGDYKGAAVEFPKWKYQKRKVLQGLVRRRAEERAMFERAVA